MRTIAGMVKRGFDSLEKSVDVLEGRMEKGFVAVNDRLERIEKLILADRKRRIERLETEMKDLKDLLAVK